MSKEIVNPKDFLKPSDTIVSGTGGLLEIVSGEGELLAEIAVPPGRHRAGIYTELVREGQSLRAGEGLVVMPARNLAAVTVYPDEINRQSDANPNWRPSHMTENERRMRALVLRKREASTRNERRAAAQQALDERRAKAAEVAAEAARQAEADEAARKAAAEAAAKATEPKLVE